MAVGQQQRMEKSPARQFLDAQIEKHPNIYGVLCILGEIASFFLNGHVVVWAARWVIRVSGYIAESALLFAVLWISGTSVAPGLAELFMSKQLMQYLVWLALITLALIPEIILANAIVNVVGRWYAVAHDRGNVGLWIWAALFTLPTFMFLILTAITLNTLGANGGNFVQASTSMVNFRLDAGWIYGLLELTYAGVKKFTSHQAQVSSPATQPPQAVAQQPQPSKQLEELAATFNQRLQEVYTKLEEMRAQPSQEVIEVSTQVKELHTKLESLTTQLAEKSVPQPDTPGETKTDTSEDTKTTRSDEKSAPETATSEDTNKITFLNTKRAQEGAQKRNSTRTKADSGSTRGKASKAARFIRNNPQILPTELAKKADISVTYARRLLAEKRTQNVVNE